MAVVRFIFAATAYRSIPRYHLTMMGRDAVRQFGPTKIPWPDLAAYIVNKYADKIVIDDDGFGYWANLPENAILALQYLAHRENEMPRPEELDEIVERGMMGLRIYILRREIGAYRENMGIEDLFMEDAEGAFSITFRNYPKLTIHGDGVFIEFRAEDVNPCFLKRIVNRELSEDEVELLRGISCLSKGTRAKYLKMASYGSLRMDLLVRALMKSAASSRERVVWLRIAEWLKSRSCHDEANKIIAEKTLVY
jgi:hypothetical protein